jgi:hypothetical protein
MFHYSDEDGHKAISSQQIWKFKATQPPGNRSFGAYFTTLTPDTPKLAARLRIPKRKLSHIFKFTGNQGLTAIEGNRGKYIFWSPTDYDVLEPRQVYHGKSEDMP